MPQAMPDHPDPLFAWALLLAAAVVVASLVPLGAARSQADFKLTDLAAPRAMFERLPAWGKRANWAHQNSFEAFTLFAPACLLALVSGVQGTLPGALALAFHNLGILGRLLLEACEAPAGRSAEQALEACGSDGRLALLYGRYSSVASSYLAYGAYRADVILRESVVVGLVGATGLGSQLLEALSSFAWDQIAALVLAYAARTLLGEDLSDRVRRRLLNSTGRQAPAAPALADAVPA